MIITSMENAFSLKGRNAIVTGGNRGLGLGIATAFAQQGANIAIFCRDEESANSVVRDFTGKYGGKYAFYKTDITDYESCKASVQGAIADFGQIDILVNNAGIGVAGEFLDMDEDFTDWFRCLDVDLNGAMRMSYLVGKHMRDNGIPGRVINISSNSGEMVNKPVTFTPYNVAKAGLNRLTKCLAYEWAKYGIRVNAIAPGYTFSDLARAMPEDAYREMCEKIPTGRFGEAIEIGALATYLASAACDNMTGAILTIDGGYSLAI